MTSPATSKYSTSHSVFFPAIAVALAAIAAAGIYLARDDRAGLPAPGSEAYEQTTRLLRERRRA